MRRPPKEVRLAAPLSYARAMSRLPIVGAVLSLVVVLDAGCQYHLDVRLGAPHPNIVSGLDSAPSSLVIGSAVQDVYVVPNSGAIYQTNIFDWRATIQAGFDNGFVAGGHGLTLEIVRADLSFAPEAVDASGVTRAARAMIRFQARTLDANGTPQQAFAGTVSAREAITDITGTIPTTNAAEAVEAMFEEIANQFYSSSPPSQEAM